VKRWLILAAVVAALVAAAILAGMNAERKVARAEIKAAEATQQAAVAKVEAGSAKAVSTATDQATQSQRRIERRAATIIKEVRSHAGASQPVDPALARAWVAGLKRLCDDAGPDACDAPDRPDGQSEGKPVPEGPPARR
jgi:hypothetical protein